MFKANKGDRDGGAHGRARDGDCIRIIRAAWLVSDYQEVYSQPLSQNR